jgi:hypothetical protein
MEKVEGEIIKELKKTTTYDDSVDLVVASKILNSEALAQDAIRRMVATATLPTKDQALRMGVEVTHSIMGQINEVRLN